MTFMARVQELWNTRETDPWASWFGRTASAQMTAAGRPFVDCRGRRRPPRLDRPGHPMAPGRRHRDDDRTGLTMTAQGDLFAAGEEARDAAVAAVSDNADVDWLDVTERIIRRLPRGETFTTDDVWAALAETTASTAASRAMGAVVRKLARAGVLLPTGQYRPSVRRECHARPIPVWRRSADDPHYREETP